MDLIVFTLHLRSSVVCFHAGSCLVASRGDNLPVMD